MFLRILVMALVALFIGSCSFKDDGRPDQAEREFCESAEEWHSTFSAWLQRLNAPGSREGDGLRQSYDLLKPNLLTVLKKAGNDDQEALRQLLRSVTRNAELWMTELSQHDFVLIFVPDATSLDSAARVALLNAALEANRIAELTRIEGNDLDREASYRLAELCGLPPLPIYSP